jgi:hypothetical protein
MPTNSCLAFLLMVLAAIPLFRLSNQSTNSDKPSTVPVVPASCQGDSEGHSTNSLWRRILDDLSLHPPTETQRLSDLRLDVQNLAQKKHELIDALNGALSESSREGWRQTRGKIIPDLQQNISDLTSKIDDEVRKGGLLAADSELNKLRNALFQKNQVIACELASIPFPLNQQDTGRVFALVGLLSKEETTLQEFDQRLGEMIKKSQEKKPNGA